MTALVSYTNEQEMLAIMQANPAEAINMLYEKYAPMLFGLICRKVQDEQLAENILAETFKKAYTELKHVNGNITAWILQLSRQICQAASKNLNEEIGVYSGESREESILRQVFCEGKNVTDVSEQWNLKANEIKRILREALQKYKMQPA